MLLEKELQEVKLERDGCTRILKKAVSETQWAPSPRETGKV